MINPYLFFPALAIILCIVGIEVFYWVNPFIIIFVAVGICVVSYDIFAWWLNNK